MFEFSLSTAGTVSGNSLAATADRFSRKFTSRIFSGSRSLRRRVAWQLTIFDSLSTSSMPQQCVEKNR